MHLKDISTIIVQMVSIEGIYLADDKDNLIFEYPITSSAPNYTTIFSSIKAVNLNIDESESILSVSILQTVYRSNFDKIKLYALVENNHQERTEDNVRLKSLDQGELTEDYESVTDTKNYECEKSEKDSTFPPNPILIFSFFTRLVEILHDYFGSPLNSLKLEANYDIICNLMQEILESGYPYITDINQLRELVPFKSSLGSKLLSTTNQIAKSYMQSSSSSASFNDSSLSHTQFYNREAPWRKSNVKYTNNELLVDIKESITLIMSTKVRKPYSNQSANTNNLNLPSQQQLIPIIATLKGTVDFTSHLSGVPDILLNLNLKNHYLGIPALHQCVRTEKWIQEQGVLSFIPPDGKSTIMEYIIELDNYPVNKAMRNIGLVVPQYKTGLGLKKNEFEISLQINMMKNVSKIEDLKVEIQTAQESFLTVKILRLSHGDFQTKSNGRSEWVFDESSSLGINPILRGFVEKSEDDSDENDREIEKSPAIFPESIKIFYSNKGSVPSGIRVDSLKITRGLNDIKPYKGVKYITRTEEFAIRQ